MEWASVFFLEAKLWPDSSHPIWYIIEHRKQPSGGLTLIGRHAFATADEAALWCATTAAARRRVPPVIPFTTTVAG